MQSQTYVACIEDDAHVRQALVGLLEAFGFTVVSFPDAEGLLSSKHLARTMCLITDIKLGGMSGLEMLEHLSASGHEIPTIVISAFADPSLRTRALKAGAVAFLSKPIAGDILISSVELALKNKPREH